MKGLKAVKELRTDIRLVPTVLGFVEGFLMENGITNRDPRLWEQAHDILLAVDEWYVNIVRHGFKGAHHGHVQIILCYEDGLITIQITDDGPAFDPHTIAPPMKPASVEEARIGGLGFHLIRNLMDSSNYRRDEGKNILTMTKRCG